MQQTIDRLLGTKVIIDVDGPLAEAPPAAEKIDEIVEFLLDYQSRLSRFEPDSEINQLNQSEQREVDASPLLRQAIATALDAADQSSGLIDPTLLGLLEDSGYDKSFYGSERLALADAVDQLELCFGQANPDSQWDQIMVKQQTIERPQGMLIDIGGSAKGLAADLAAAMVDGQYQHWLINLGGDLRLGGETARQIEVVSPFDLQSIDSFPVRSGAIATSGIDSRLWLKDGRYHHHLLDPLSEQPVFSGLVSATAFAASAVEAEILAKVALMRGEAEAETVLAAGGIIILADGQSRRVGKLAQRRLRLKGVN